MIPNCNDSSNRPPRLRFDLNIGSISELPATSSFPIFLPQDDHSRYRYLRTKGIEGLNWGNPDICRQTDLFWTGGGRFDSPAEVDGKIIDLKNAGYDCGTFHVGTGFETDDEMDDYAKAIISAAQHSAFPVFVETHRATATQDIYRTVKWVERNPELRFNGDFSHYYTGHEMIYGDLEKKLAFLAPVLERVRFIHGRIGNSCCMQTEVTDLESTNVAHFRAFWTQSFVGFLKTARHGDYFCFAPELLAPGINYARTFRNTDGIICEEGDRWQQVLLYWQIACECWMEAEQRCKSVTR
ncbi:MAG: hypothetical protein SH807_09600 [Blastochloris sp.]|nr:hypothetical protein [Blastochloris sp.]